MAGQRWQRANDIAAAKLRVLGVVVHRDISAVTQLKKLSAEQRSEATRRLDVLWDGFRGEKVSAQRVTARLRRRRAEAQVVALGRLERGTDATRVVGGLSELELRRASGLLDQISEGWSERGAWVDMDHVASVMGDFADDSDWADAAGDGVVVPIAAVGESGYSVWSQPPADTHGWRDFHDSAEAAVAALGAGYEDIAGVVETAGKYRIFFKDASR